jgi:YfiH family protein
MPFKFYDGIRFFKLDLLNCPEIAHGFFTRQGGTSPFPWESLNMGGMVGDDRKRVEMNRVRAFQAVGRDPASMYDVWQVHGTEVICVDKPRPVDVEHKQADAVITNNPEVTLFMRFADCIPIILYDPVNKVVGLVHSGWRGTVKKVAKAAILGMVQNYGSKPDDILAGIGPSICVDHYSVGPEIVEEVHKAFGNFGNRLLLTEDGIVKFDLWEANRHLLVEAGLMDIEMSGLCTASNLNDWYSHRGENGKTGRFGALICLNSNG